MLTITRATSYVALGFISVLAITVGYRLLNGEINTRHMLGRKGQASDSSVSPERLQLLLSTIASAGMYMGRAIEARGSTHLPDMPASFLVGLGVSNAIYLGAKAFTMLDTRRKPSGWDTRS